MPEALVVPQFDDDVDALTAALGWAEAGFYVLPGHPDYIRNPGRIVGKGWQHKSSREPDQIVAWFAGTNNVILVHCGRSGLVGFDIDHPEQVPDVLAAHLPTAPFQQTRPDEQPDRGHALFAMPADRTIGNSTGKLGGAWGEIRGLNGVLLVAPVGSRRWLRTGIVPVLPNEIAELLNDASPASDAASDAVVTAFLEAHQQATRPQLVYGWTKALTTKIEAGNSRHNTAVSVVAGALKEAGAGYLGATSALAVLQTIFINAVMLPPRERTEAEASDEWQAIVAWGVGQALGADLDAVRARTEAKMPKDSPTHGSGRGDDDDDDETVRTVPWPTLSDAALHGVAGRIVRLAAPHTEADPAAILVHLLAILGAAIGPEPHIVVGNEHHQAIINPLIVGKTNNGAKGTALAVVEAIRRQALPGFDEFTTSGLSTDVGLIERVRDPVGEEGDQDYIPGVDDKRLLVKEREYRAVLVRSRREGNTLGQTLRDAFDCCTLETLTRKRNRLRATRPHIVVIGHVTPREFRATLDDSDLSGGSVNRLLICLSRRSRLDSRLGNLPDDALTEAADLMKRAYATAMTRRELGFTDEFWKLWDSVYPELNRDRPDCNTTDATARGVIMVLRLALLYALTDGAEIIDAEHLDAALALWAYAEHSARWLFSTHEQEIQRQESGGLVSYILAGGSAGRTRTEISKDCFKHNKSAAQINAELAPLVHDGVIIEIKEEREPTTRGRRTTRYVHRGCVKNGFTKSAGQDTDSAANLSEETTNKTNPSTSRGAA